MHIGTFTYIFAFMQVAILVTLWVFPDSRRWLICSLEETPGRASGKAIVVFLLSLLFIFTHLYVLLHKDLGFADFSDQQEKLVDSGYSVIVWLIPTLYGIKVVGKGKWFNVDNNDQPNNTNTDSK